MPNINHLVERFLAWPLPKSVCADPCASNPDYPGRSGTNLLNADQARQMLEHVLANSEQPTCGRGKAEQGYMTGAQRPMCRTCAHVDESWQDRHPRDTCTYRCMLGNFAVQAQSVCNQYAVRGKS